LTYLAASGKPDLILLDMLMPRCDGPTTVRTIRRNPRFEGMRIFAVSGTAPSDLGVELGPQGIDRWFQKPLDPEKLVSELQSVLGVAV
jgi:CheY-like chemotaxis protein